MYKLILMCTNHHSRSHRCSSWIRKPGRTTHT